MYAEQRILKNLFSLSAIPVDVPNYYNITVRVIENNVRIINTKMYLIRYALKLIFF